MAVTTSNIKLEPMTVSFKPPGGSFTDLGGTTGPVEISLGVETVPITSEQTGGMVLDEKLNSLSAEISVTLREFSDANMQMLIGGVTGGNHTPDGGTETTGFGSDALFRSMDSKAGELLLVPVGGSSSARSFLAHKAIAIPDSLSFSSENPTELSITFRLLKDSSKDATVDLWVFGDVSQSFA